MKTEPGIMLNNIKSLLDLSVSAPPVLRVPYLHMSADIFLNNLLRKIYSCTCSDVPSQVVRRFDNYACIIQISFYLFNYCKKLTLRGYEINYFINLYLKEKHRCAHCLWS